MKKSISFLLTLTALVLCACGGSVPQQTDEPAEVSASPAASALPGVYPLDFFKDTEALWQQEQDGTELVRVSYPVLSLSQEDSVKFSALSNALLALNSDAASAGSSSYDQLLPLAQAELARCAAAAGVGSGEDAPVFKTFYRKVNLTLPRADSRAVSVLYSLTSYSGGTEGDVFYYSSNFDSASGRLLSLSDVVLDLPEFRDILEAGLREKYAEVDFTALEDALNGYMSDLSSLTWTLDYQGLSFFFAAGTLAPYDDGAMQLSLRFADNLRLFSLYYTAVPTAYAVPLTGGSCLNYDFDQDGKADEISVERIYGDDGSIEKLKISVNGKVFTANTPMTDCDCYVVRPGTGRSYLFISAQNLTGYGYISVYLIDRTGASLAGMQYESSLYAASYTPACAGTTLLTDPGYFMMGTRIQYLGTLTGLKVYSIGTDGMPVSSDSYYQLYGADPLTLKTQLVTATIDAAGSGTFAAETFPAGTRLSFWRGDGSGSMDMYTDDGVYCRLYVSGKPGSQKVNGVPVENVFDGIVY